MVIFTEKKRGYFSPNVIKKLWKVRFSKLGFQNPFNQITQNNIGVFLRGYIYNF